MRIGMAAGRDSDTRTEVEISLAAFRHKPNAFATLKAQRGPGKGVEKRRFSHGGSLLMHPIADIQKIKMPPSGRPRHYRHSSM
jgi:hypothetical protein